PVDTMKAWDMPTAGALGGAWTDSLALAADTLHQSPDSLAGQVAALEPHRADPDSTHPALPHNDYPRWTGGTGFESGALPDSGPPLPVVHPLSDGDGPFALSDTVLAQRPSKYKARFSADFAGGQVYGGSFGVLGATQLALSDFLGDQRLDMAVGL